MLKILILIFPLIFIGKTLEEPNTMVQKNAKGTILNVDNEEDWFNLAPNGKGSSEGVSVNLAYETFGPAKKEIIVAVIDSGVDINHEDLKGKIWMNKEEIPNNGIDDDKNGYIDDFYGWNFLGSKKGMGKVLRDGTFKKGRSTYQANEEPLEFARELGRLSKLDRELSKKEKEYKAELVKYKKSQRRTCKNEETPWYCDSKFESYARKLINKEKDDGLTSSYGNNDIIGPDPSHGTHVAGIIAANRRNHFGVNGIASNVKIMSLRAVPDGDEYDEDIANSIIYAVDNGARVINMSFGKSFSPKKKIVNLAVRYAREKGVLLVHSAGNSAREITLKNNFPNKDVGTKYLASNWIEVGASTIGTKFIKRNDDGDIIQKGLAANFSNYSKKYVDLFAPGYGINSTTPDNNYDAYSGTSMASPVVAGCAALILGHYPELKPSEVKAVLAESTRKYPNASVIRPRKTKFSSLSKEGGIVDVHESLRMLKVLLD